MISNESKYWFNTNFPEEIVSKASELRNNSDEVGHYY